MVSDCLSGSFEDGRDRIEATCQEVVLAGCVYQLYSDIGLHTAGGFCEVAHNLRDADLFSQLIHLDRKLQLSGGSCDLPKKVTNFFRGFQIGVFFFPVSN